MNRIEVTIDGQDIVITNWCRLDINEAEGLRDILDACIRRINDDAREDSERQQAEQRRMEAERSMASSKAKKPIVTAEDVADWVNWRGWRRPDPLVIALRPAGTSGCNYWISGGVVLGTEREVAAGVHEMRATRKRVPK